MSAWRTAEGPWIGPWIEVAVRTFVATFLASVAAAGVAVLAFGEVADFAPGVGDVVAVLLFVVLVVVGTTAVHHLTRRGAVWRGRAARWWFAALVAVATILAVGVVAFGTALLTAGEGVGDSTLGVAFLVWLFVLVVTGLPAWAFLLALALGPGPASVGGPASGMTGGRTTTTTTDVSDDATTATSTGGDGDEVAER